MYKRCTQILKTKVSFKTLEHTIVMKAEISMYVYNIYNMICIYDSKSIIFLKKQGGGGKEEGKKYI